MTYALSEELAFEVLWDEARTLEKDLEEELEKEYGSKEAGQVRKKTHSSIVVSYREGRT